MEDVHNLINIGPTNPIQIWNQHEIFWRFCMCNSNDTLDKNKKYWSRYWGSTAKTGSLTRDKANISNPKVNRGCAPLTANRTSADCVQIALGPSIPYIPLGVYHTGRFNAMPNISPTQVSYSINIQQFSTKLTSYKEALTTLKIHYENVRNYTHSIWAIYPLMSPNHDSMWSLKFLHLTTSICCQATSKSSLIFCT